MPPSTVNVDGQRRAGHVAGVVGGEEPHAGGDLVRGSAPPRRNPSSQFARRGVTVNAVAPGFIETDMTADLPVDVKQAVPARRAGTPEEVAAAVRFLASDDAGYVTGTTLFVDGGMSA